MINLNHPNSPYYDDSWENIEVWKIEATYGGEFVDCWWEPDENEVWNVHRDMSSEYPNCAVNVYCCSILDCPKPRREQILRYIEDNRRDYEDISFWRDYVSQNR